MRLINKEKVLDALSNWSMNDKSAWADEMRIALTKDLDLLNDMDADVIAITTEALTIGKNVITKTYYLTKNYTTGEVNRYSKFKDENRWEVTA